MDKILRHPVFLSFYIKKKNFPTRRRNTVIFSFHNYFQYSCWWRFFPVRCLFFHEKMKHFLLETVLWIGSLSFPQFSPKMWSTRFFFSQNGSSPPTSPNRVGAPKNRRGSVSAEAPGWRSRRGPGGEKKIGDRISNGVRRAENDSERSLLFFFLIYKIFSPKQDQKTICWTKNWS